MNNFIAIEVQLLHHQATVANDRTSFRHLEETGKAFRGKNFTNLSLICYPIINGVTSEFKLSIVQITQMSPVVVLKVKCDN